MLFFFNDTATTEIYTLSLHDALPISVRDADRRRAAAGDVQRALDHGRRAGEIRIQRAEARRAGAVDRERQRAAGDRKSTRLNSSHANISYAVFCLKKKKNITHTSHAI